MIPDNIHESWLPHFESLFSDSRMETLYKGLPKTKHTPTGKTIFRVFEQPLDDIKVVILGQDPYPAPGQAVGLAFAVPPNTPKPVSLKAIEKEVGHDIDRTLVPWLDQRVFLLNTALTTGIGKPGSHTEYWNWFTRRVIVTISENSPCIWMLWGKEAQKFKPLIGRQWLDKEELPDRPDQYNFVLEAPHPAAEYYSSGKAGFYGSNHFQRCNNLLTLQGKTPIIW